MNMATEKRLIERIADRLKDAYPQADRNNLCPAIYYDDFAEIVDDVLSEFEEAVDAVEVVRARWVDNHCTACGMMPMGEELWKHMDIAPPRMECFMDYWPCCGAKMDRG